jgi:hypothetical protein
MICPKCGTEMQVQAQKEKNPILLGLVLAFGGFGLMFLGIPGALIGALLGLIIGAIIKGLMKTQYESVFVCQSCGNIIHENGKRKKQPKG